MEEARTGKTLTGQPSKRTKLGQKQILAEDPALDKSREMMAAHFGPKKQAKPRARSYSPPKVKKKKRKKHRGKKERLKAADIKADKGFAVKGSHWDPTDLPKKRGGRKRRGVPTRAQSDSDIEIVEPISPGRTVPRPKGKWVETSEGVEKLVDADPELVRRYYEEAFTVPDNPDIRKRAPPKASLPGREHKPKRKDEKQIEVREQVVKARDNLDAGVANILELTAALKEHHEEEDTKASKRRADIGDLEDRRDALEASGYMDPNEDEALQAMVHRLEKKRKDELNARHVQEQELEGSIDMASDLLKTARQTLKDYGGKSEKQRAKIQGRVQKWETQVAEYSKELKELQASGPSVRPLEIARGTHLSEEVWEEMAREGAVEDLPPVPEISDVTSEEKGPEAAQDMGDEKLEHPKPTAGGPPDFDKNAQGSEKHHPAVKAARKAIAEKRKKYDEFLNKHPKIKKTLADKPVGGYYDLSDEQQSAMDKAIKPWTDEKSKHYAVLSGDHPSYNAIEKLLNPRTATKESRAEVLAVHGVGGMPPKEFKRKSGTVTQTQAAHVDMQAIMNTDLAHEDFSRVATGGNNPIILANYLLTRLGGNKRDMTKKDVQRFKKKLEELQKNPKYRKSFTDFFEKRRWERFVDQYINPKYLIYDPEEQAKDKARLKSLGRYESPPPSSVSSSGLESDDSGRGATGRGYQAGGRTRPTFLRSGHGRRQQRMSRFLQTEPTGNVPYAGGRRHGRRTLVSALSEQLQDDVWDEILRQEGGPPDEIPEEPEAPRKRRLTTKQSAHGRNYRRKIMPVLKRANFSLRKVSPGRYIVSAQDVSQGVIEQIKALLQKIPGKRILVDGRIFGKQSAFREIIRVLRKNGTVEVSL